MASSAAWKELHERAPALVVYNRVVSGDGTTRAELLALAGFEA